MRKRLIARTKHQGCVHSVHHTRVAALVFVWRNTPRHNLSREICRPFLTNALFSPQLNSSAAHAAPVCLTWPSEAPGYRIVLKAHGLTRNFNRQIK
eukprot:6184025-Pleurochrysis_carterae.AAC.2